jgi:hypothetical protein
MVPLSGGTFDLKDGGLRGLHHSDVVDLMNCELRVKFLKGSFNETLQLFLTLISVGGGTWQLNTSKNERILVAVNRSKIFKSLLQSLNSLNYIYKSVPI